MYLHGSVGAGKTLLMDLFLASLQNGLPRVRAHRVHLHDFLRDIHAELHRAKLLGIDGTNYGGDAHGDSAKPLRRCCPMPLHSDLFFFHLTSVALWVLALMVAD